jgi:hypothetical protein
MKLELKRIGVWSIIKISFILNLILGFIIGIFYALLFLFMASLPMTLAQDESAGMFSAFAGITAIFLPFICAIFCAVFNTLLAAICGLVYNLVVKATGGIELEFGQVVQMVPAAAPAIFPQPPIGGDQQSTI